MKRKKKEGFSFEVMLCGAIKNVLQDILLFFG